MRNTSTDPVDWRAKWIWLPNAPEQAQTTLQFRWEFEWHAEMGDATRLLIPASHIYRVLLNGQPVGRGPDRADPRRPYYDVYDIAGLLQPGKNLLTGLARRFRPHPGNRSSLYDGAPGLLAQLEAGGRTVIATDATWRVRAAPAGEIEIGWEKTDARWELEVLLPPGMSAELILPRLSWGRERLLINRREAWRAEAREDYRRQLERNYVHAGPREVRALLEAPGRHLVELESF